MYNILLLGSGGREHALAWKMAQSTLCNHLYVAPGNAGTSSIATNVNLQVLDFEGIKTFCITNQINLLVVGPEDPLVKGIYDFFAQNEPLKHIPIIGCSEQAAQLEGSKDFAKQFMFKNGIPTAQYKTFTKDSLNEGWTFLETLNPPYVLKADGLAAGKGVLILTDLQEAKNQLQDMLLNEKFGVASQRVVIEEYLDGIEASCFVLTNGISYKILPFAKDYKRVGEGDTGLNTGGMGAVSPVPFIDVQLQQKIEQQIVIPTVKGLQADNLVYNGFVFIGLMIVQGNPYVIEYNVRMGDPETEVVIPRIESDLLELFKALIAGQLSDFSLLIDSRTAVTVMAVSGGYPEHFEKGKEITGWELITDDNVQVFQAGTTLRENTVVSNGGRVLTVTAWDNTLTEATKKSYQNIAKLHFDKMYYRTDIGQDLF